MDIFIITPASPKPLWFLSIIGFIILIVLIALVFIAYASRNSKVELGNNILKLSGDFWGREIAFDQLDVSGAKIINLSKKTEFSPKWRTLGTGLPGYSSGWFRLRNGEKALVYLTRRNEVLYLPTTQGYSLLLSLDEPQRFMDTLNKYRNKNTS